MTRNPVDPKLPGGTPTSPGVASTGPQPPSAGELADAEWERLKLGSEGARDTCKQVLTVAAAIVTVTAGFAKSLADSITNGLARVLLEVSWTALAISVVAGCSALWVLAVEIGKRTPSADPDKDGLGRPAVKGWVGVEFVAFAAGIVAAWVAGLIVLGAGS